MPKDDDCWTPCETDLDTGTKTSTPKEGSGKVDKGFKVETEDELRKRLRLKLPTVI